VDLGNADAMACLGKCYINGHGVQKILKNAIDLTACALSNNSRILTILDLTDNKVGDEEVNTICQSLIINTTLTKLNLSHNKIGSTGAKAISEVLKRNKTLTELNLLHNEIGIDGALSITQLLKINPSVKILFPTMEEEALRIGTPLFSKYPDIKTSTEIEGTKENLKVLCELLKWNSLPTKKLKLNDNKIGVEETKIISDSLKHNTTLTELSLYQNSIGVDGSRILSESLKVNTTLTKLDLGYNNIREQGARMICESLKINPTLTWLSLVGDEFKTNQSNTYIYMVKK